jgi:hypothetical protein
VIEEELNFILLSLAALEENDRVDLQTKRRMCNSSSVKKDSQTLMRSYGRRTSRGGSSVTGEVALNFLILRSRFCGVSNLLFDIAVKVPRFFRKKFRSICSTQRTFMGLEQSTISDKEEGCVNSNIKWR